MKFYIKSFGCQYNEWDASRLAFFLNQLGLEESDKEKADLVFLLNCSVRKTGVDRAMSFTKNFVGMGKRVFVSGCVLESDKKIFIDHGATLWDGDDFAKLCKLLNVDLKNHSPLYALPSTNLVPITKGCNNFCSYCAVPYTRGREISRPIEDILVDVKKVIEVGHKDVWLLGQNVNSYHGSSLTDIPASSSVIPAPKGTPRVESGILRSPGTTLENTAGPEDDNNVGFAQLLEQINNLPGDFTIYFTSNHPKDMSDEIIEAIATLPKVAKSIHLPLQSGSNKILKAMNRPYTREQYLEIVEKIKGRIPNAVLSTDTIVGFPGETEEDFQQTVEVLKSVKFLQVFNNKYSPRSGTVAFKLGDPIPWCEKQRRWKISNEIYGKK